MGNIGEDYPSATLRLLRKLHVDTALLSKTRRSSTRFHIARFQGSRKLRVVDPGIPIRLPARMRLVEGMHMGPVFNEISGSLVKNLRRKCDFLSVDLQGFIREISGDGLVRTVHRKLGGILGHCDMVQASIEEARSQTGFRDPMAVLSHLLAIGCQYAVVTMGRRGSLMGSQTSGVFFVPAFHDDDIRDPTGAGDVFAGSWLSTYLSTKDAVWASAVGSAFASLASRKNGLSKFEISKSELVRRSGWVYDRIRPRLER